MNTPRINIIAAIGSVTRAIGKHNTLLWHIPEDMRRFKTLTTGHPIIMGRNTFESIGCPLLGRTNIVLTHARGWRHDGVHVYHSLEHALMYATNIEKKEVFIIGGAQIYTLALPRAQRLFLTLVDDDTAGDTFFPPYEHLELIETYRENHGEHTPPFTFLTLEKRSV